MVTPYMEKVFDMVRTLDQLDWYGRSCHCDRLQALYPDLWHDVRVFFAPDEMRDGTKTAPTVANGEIIPLFDRERPMTWFDLYKARAPKAPPVPKKAKAAPPMHMPIEWYMVPKQEGQPLPPPSYKVPPPVPPKAMGASSSSAPAASCESVDAPVCKKRKVDMGI